MSNHSLAHSCKPPRISLLTEEAVCMWIPSNSSKCGKWLRATLLRISENPKGSAWPHCCEWISDFWINTVYITEFEAMLCSWSIYIHSFAVKCCHRGEQRFSLHVFAWWVKITEHFIIFLYVVTINNLCWHQKFVGEKSSPCWAITVLAVPTYNPYSYSSFGACGVTP